MGWGALPHPPCSPDIAFSDYHLFRLLKHHLIGKSFAKFEDFEMAIRKFFESQPQDLWAGGINDLPFRWAAVVDNCGEYTGEKIFLSVK